MAIIASRTIQNVLNHMDVHVTLITFVHIIAIQKEQSRVETNVSRTIQNVVNRMEQHVTKVMLKDITKTMT